MLEISNLKKVVITLLIILIAFPITVLGFIYYKLNSVYIPDDYDKTDQMQDNSIVNILLVGVDGAYLDKGNRSDSMMIFTIDNKNKCIKLTSLARDTYVDINGYSTEKLTHAYAYEGPTLLLDAIRENFELNIDKYITVNFNSFIDLVDIVDGVEVMITENDLDILNSTIPGCYELDTKENKKDIKLVEKSGMNLLNGYQALAFSRIRYHDGAYERDRRQREVIEGIIKKVEDTGIEKYMAIINAGIKNVKTNISPKEMLSLGYSALKIGSNDIKQLEFPIYKSSEKLDKKGWVIKWDKDKNLDDLNEFIFENKDVTQ
ncbi:LCP family protein [[Clostridium] dakarense]|uniref:LCP family protein n=1 Tax=Faecalimicrobium dakarense TaxID=1301100 RepID=UPI0004B71B1B|nr:LCP family protein [[Clostridium] dakarense]